MADNFVKMAVVGQDNHLVVGQVDQVIDDNDDIIEGDFVITRKDGKKARSILYIARVEAIDDDGYEGVFLRKVPSHTNFDRPTFIVDETDCGTFSKEDIVKKNYLHPNF